jgi:hypothetical protein
VGLFHGPFFVYINDLYAHRLLPLINDNCMIISLWCIFNSVGIILCEK